MQAIVTKYLGATDSRGSRIIARADAGSVTVAWDYAIDDDANHRAAAEALCARLGWKGKLACGGMPPKSAYACVFVFVTPSTCETLRAKRARTRAVRRSQSELAAAEAKRLDWKARK